MSTATAAAPAVPRMPLDGDRPSAIVTIRRGLALTPALRTGLGGTLVLALIATAGRAIVPIAVQRTIDVIATSGDSFDADRITGIGVLAILGIVVMGFASAMMNVRLAKVTAHALSDLRVRTFRHVHDLSMLHQAAQQRGALVSRVTTDVEAISQFLNWAGVQLMANTGQFFVALLVMVFYSWQLTIVAIAALIPFTLVMRAFQRRLVVAYLEVRARIAHLLAVLGEAVVGAPVVRAYGVEDHTRQRLDEAIEDHRKSGIAAGALSAGFTGSSEIFVGLATSAVIIAGVILGVDGDITPGTVLVFPFLIVLLLQPMQMIGEQLNEAQTAVAGWARVLDVLDLEPDVADPVDGVPLPQEALSVCFDDVSFRYPLPGETGRSASGPMVLHDVTVSFPALSRIAVVGETGSGKTTFAKLLTRLMDPSEGSVVLGGTDVSRVEFGSLRRRVVMVPQDDVLFDGTIADNIRYVEPDLDDEAVTGAFTRLGLRDWLEAMPEGIQTRVGERGSSLSAGERQLVSLVRASLTDPDVLVLDEATSAVDPATEVRLTRAITELSADRTVVTIAHRLSTAEAADEVLVFADGRLVQRGPHAELVQQGGVYARLHASWMSGKAG